MLKSVFRFIKRSFGVFDRVPSIERIKYATYKMDLDVHYYLSDHIPPSFYNFERIMSMSSEEALRHYRHDFSFLRDMSYRMSSDIVNQEVVQHVQDIVMLWIMQQGRFSGISWSPDLAANRLYFLAMYYDVYFGASDNETKSLVIGHIILHARFLNMICPLLDSDRRLLVSRSVLVALSGLAQQKAIKILHETAMMQFTMDIKSLINSKGISSVTAFMALRTLLDVRQIKTSSFIEHASEYFTAFASSVICGKNVVRFNASTDLSILLPSCTREIQNVKQLIPDNMGLNDTFVGNIIKARMKDSALFLCHDSGDNPAIASFEFYFCDIPIIINRTGTKVQNHSTLQVRAAWDRVSDISKSQTGIDSSIIGFMSYSRRYNIRHTREIIVTKRGIFGRDLVLTKACNYVYIRFYLSSECKVIKNSPSKIIMEVDGAAWEFGGLGCIMFFQNDMLGNCIELSLLPSDKYVYWYLHKRPEIN